MLSCFLYLLTPWCRVLLEKLTGAQLVKKFPAFHGTPRFITVPTRVRHLSLSWASPIQSIYPHPTSRRSTLILSTHLRLFSLVPEMQFPNTAFGCIKKMTLLHFKCIIRFKLPVYKESRTQDFGKLSCILLNK